MYRQTRIVDIIETQDHKYSLMHYLFPVHSFLEKNVLILDLLQAINTKAIFIGSFYKFLLFSCKLYCSALANCDVAHFALKPFITTGANFFFVFTHS